MINGIAYLLSHSANINGWFYVFVNTLNNEELFTSVNDSESISNIKR